MERDKEMDKLGRGRTKTSGENMERIQGRHTYKNKKAAVTKWGRNKQKRKQLPNNARDKTNN